MMVHPGQQEDRQRVVARLVDDEQLSASGGWHEKGIAGEWVQVRSRTVFAPVSHQKARISFELHGCVTWISMPRTALEPLDSSWQPAQFIVLDDRRLQVNRVDHRSFAGYSLHNLGSGQ